MGIFDALLGGPKFNASKCKTALRLCVGRVKLLRNKKAHAVATLKREIGDLLNAGKEDSARVRVEAVLREEATLEAFEVLDLFCELLVVRLPLIESTKDLPADLKEAVATVVYAARRVADAIPELKEVRAQFAGKYGSQYVAACGEDTTAGACGVSELAMRKLALAPPSAEARLEALRAVAAERGVRFDEAKMAETTREAKMAETTPEAKMAETTREAAAATSRGPPPVAHASSPGDGAAFADAGQAAAAARAAAAACPASANAAPSPGEDACATGGGPRDVAAAASRVVSAIFASGVVSAIFASRVVSAIFASSKRTPRSAATARSASSRASAEGGASASLRMASSLTPHAPAVVSSPHAATYCDPYLPANCALTSLSSGIASATRRAAYTTVATASLRSAGRSFVDSMRGSRTTRSSQKRSRTSNASSVASSRSTASTRTRAESSFPALSKSPISRFKVATAWAFLLRRSLTRPTHSRSAVLHLDALNLGPPSKASKMPIVPAREGRAGEGAARRAMSDCLPTGVGAEKRRDAGRKLDSKKIGHVSPFSDVHDEHLPAVRVSVCGQFPPRTPGHLPRCTREAARSLSRTGSPWSPSPFTATPAVPPWRNSLSFPWDRGVGRTGCVTAGLQASATAPPAPWPRSVPGACTAPRRRCCARGKGTTRAAVGTPRSAPSPRACTWAGLSCRAS